jgi:hypothetical protein
MPGMLRLIQSREYNGKISAHRPVLCCWSTGPCHLQVNLCVMRASTRQSFSTHVHSNFLRSVLISYYHLRTALWSSDQNSWLRIQKSGLDSRRYQIFWEVVGLERGPPSLVSKIEELLGIDSSGSGLESLEYGRRGSAELTRWHHSIHKSLPLTSPTSGGRSFGIVHSRTKATEFLFNYHLRPVYTFLWPVFTNMFLSSHPPWLDNPNCI